MHIINQLGCLRARVWIVQGVSRFLLNVATEFGATASPRWRLYVFQFGNRRKAQVPVWTHVSAGPAQLLYLSVSSSSTWCTSAVVKRAACWRPTTCVGCGEGREPLKALHVLEDCFQIRAESPSLAGWILHAAANQIHGLPCSYEMTSFFVFNRMKYRTRFVSYVSRCPEL